ncbi:hypothetical protein ASE74_20625 [Pedobacter sp. Leaf216]|uniref:hypothetical protein n=1 Tax=Pedobacter sp. Leaf216 TaxID=1735684 RepID=UPI0006F25C9D|nr:hypothetical protein [Pedobacter sp. Leaf216]KQM75228.1 hypothetical protein ASE74_20625 [Pedobacter sp. Leaf216]
MTYILEKTEKLKFHTNLRELLYPIIESIGDYNWLLTNQDYFIFDFEQKGEVHKLDFESKKIEFSGSEFKALVETRNIQFIWGVFCAFIGEIPSLKSEEFPFADCNENIWKKPNEFLSPNSEIEIICFDGTSTIIKFKNQKMEKEFLQYFSEAKLLL